MKDNLLKIINTYGVLPQLKYFQSEVFELNEAIINYENEPLKELGAGTKEHIAEEIVDNFVMIYQFPEYYYERLEYQNIPHYEFRTDNYEHIDDILKYLKEFQKEELCEFTCSIAILEERDQDYITEYQYKCFQKIIDNVIYKLKSIQSYYKISDKEIEEVMKFKIERQLGRIERGE